MNIIKLVVLICLVSKAVAAEDSIIKPTLGLEQSYFCAICEPVDAGGYEKPMAEKYPRLDFFRLKPVKIYWGSVADAKPSLRLHPFEKNRPPFQMLVVLRKPEHAGPGEWVKSYIPIQKNARDPSDYLLDRKGTVSGDDLKRFLEQYSKVMQKKFPLDKESPRDVVIPK